MKQTGKTGVQMAVHVPASDFCLLTSVFSDNP